jgi:hypothetical protein
MSSEGDTTEDITLDVPFSSRLIDKNKDNRKFCSCYTAKYATP